MAAGRHQLAVMQAVIELRNNRIVWANDTNLKGVLNDAGCNVAVNDNTQIFIGRAAAGLGAHPTLPQ